METDYLVVGAGAMAMAFVDELLHRDSTIRVIMVDRRSKPGGHWVDAYPFVTLHQPALFYGVNSEFLGDGGDDLVSKAQILGYYERVLKKLEKTRRLSFLPQTEYLGEGQVRSLMTGATQKIHVRKRIVDATYSAVTVPATTAPKFDVDQEVTLVPPNDLATLQRPWKHYTVIGAGKTGIDALLYLLSREVSPNDITWVVSRDAWLIARESILPKHTADTLTKQFLLATHIKDTDEFFLECERMGLYFRLNPDVMPTCYRCATVSRAEFVALRTLTKIIRKGYVKRISKDQMTLEKGTIPSTPETLYINATADGLARRPARPIFQKDAITLQPVTHCQPTFSASVIAMLESRSLSDEAKNQMAAPIPHPSTPDDMIEALYAQVSSLDSWDLQTLLWSAKARLNASTHVGVISQFKMVWTFLRWKKRFFTNAQKCIAAQSQVHTEAPETTSKESA